MKFGSRKNARPLKERLEEQFIPEPNSGCWLWTGTKTGRGYGSIKLRYRTLLAHRASYEIYKAQIPLGLQICHRCDNPLCVNPDHMFLGDAQANADDKVRKGRHRSPVGEEHPLARLSAAQALEIYNAQGNHAAIAARFGISSSYVSEIKNGRKWRSVTQDASRRQDSKFVGAYANRS